MVKKKLMHFEFEDPYLTELESRVLGAALSQYHFLYPTKKYDVIIDNRPYVVTTKYPIARRTRGRSNQIRYEIYAPEYSKGAGSFNEVFRVIGTLFPILTGGVMLKKFKQRLMRKGGPIPDKIMEFQSDVGKDVKHLHIKNTSVDKKEGSTYTVVEEMEGENLIHQRAAFQSLNAEQLLQLTINLIRALQEQVHDYGLVHRDIKPDNIIGDLKNLAVNIIDYETAIPNELIQDVNERCGTLVYVAPEQIQKHRISEQSDIYSLGATLGIPWRIKSPRLNFYNEHREERKFVNLSVLDLSDHSIAYSRLSLLTEKERSVFIPILKAMTENDIKKRNVNLKEAASTLDEMLVERKINRLGLKGEAALAFKKAHDIGEELRRENVPSNMQRSDLTIEELIALKLGSFNSDDPILFKEFIESSQVRDFENVTDKVGLMNVIDNLQSEKLQLLIKLEKIISDLNVQKSESESEEFEHERTQLLYEAQHLIEKPKQNLTIDEAFELNARLKAGLEDLKIRVRRFDFKEKQFPKFKVYLRYVLARYLFEHQKKQFYKEGESFSNDIALQDLIIHDLTHNPKFFNLSKNNFEVLKGMVASIDNGKSYSDTIGSIYGQLEGLDRGFFNKSRLFDYFDQAIESFERNKEMDARSENENNDNFRP